MTISVWKSCFQFHHRKIKWSLWMWIEFEALWKNCKEIHWLNHHNHKWVYCRILMSQVRMVLFGRNTHIAMTLINTVHNPLYLITGKPFTFFVVGIWWGHWTDILNSCTQLMSLFNVSAFTVMTFSCGW